MTGGYTFQNERDVRDVAGLVHERRRSGGVTFDEPIRQSAGGDTRFEFYHSILVPAGARVTGIYQATFSVSAAPGSIGRAEGVVGLVHTALGLAGPRTYVDNGPLATTRFAAAPYIVRFQPANSAYMEALSVTVVIPFTYWNDTPADRMVTVERVASINTDYHTIYHHTEVYCYKYGSMSTFALLGEE